MTAQEPPGEDTPTPPSPNGVPLLGNGLEFSRNPVEAMETWASLGDVVEIKTPGRSTYMVTHPALIEQILVQDHSKFTISSAQRETFRGVEDHAVTTTTGKRWTRLRGILQPAFTRDVIRQHTDRMAATMTTYVDEWDDGERIDLYREMRLLTVNVLADTLLGIDARGKEDIVMDAADALVERANFRRLGRFLPDWIPTPTEQRFKRSVGALDDFVDTIIDERRDAESSADLCSMLLDAYQGGELSLDEVRHNLVAMLLAGHDSPSVALTYTLYLVDGHPTVQESLVKQSHEVIDDDQPYSEVYDELNHTRNVVSEALRLYPPTLGVSRQATAPVTLGDYDFPKGAGFLLPQWVVHRDERFWDDSTSFTPSRWQEPGNRQGYAYFPFSGGPRYCIGRYFARQELALALVTILGRVELDVSMDGPLTFTPSLQLRPESDIEAIVNRR